MSRVSVVRIDFLTFLGQNTIEVRILGEILQVSEKPVPDRKRGPQMSIFSSAGHNMTAY